MVWTAWQKLIQDYNIRDVVIFRCFLLNFSGIEIHLSASVNDLMCVCCVEEVKNMQSTSGGGFYSPAAQLMQNYKCNVWD